MPFVAGLNSDFAGVIHHRNKGEVSLFTDRLGSRPIYYTRADDGALVFSSLLQSLSNHPHVSVELDPEFLREFIHYGRSLGIYTPFEDVYQLPPASVMTFDVEGRKIDEWTYWWPKPSPENKSFSNYVSEFAQTLETVVRERLPSEGQAGLLLSGGIDSRAILAAAHGELIGFHMNEPIDRNKEEWVARRAAEVAGANFRFLERYADYYPSVLSKIKTISNLNGIFTHAHAIGFSENINTESNYLFCGQYSDTLINGTYVPKSHGEAKTIDTVDDYIDEFDKGKMGGHARDIAFVQNLPDRTNVLKNHIELTEEGPKSHGVAFPSWESLVQFGIVYPITNARTFVFF